MTSPHAHSPHLLLLLHSPSLGLYNKFVFLPKLSLPTANPSGKPLSCSVCNKKKLSFPLELSNLNEKKGISLVEKCNDLPIQEENTEYRKQVQNLVDAIRALPCKERIDDILKICTKDGEFRSISDFNDLLMALIIANESGLALKLYSHISTHGLAPDSWTFSIIIRCHCKRNDVDEAKRVLDHMLQNRWNPNVATFTMMIDALCKKGKLQRAFQVIEVMGAVGCRPTVQTYNCLLKGLCYVGRVEEAFELVEDIKKTSIGPDIYTYNIMMNGFCKVGRSDEAVELLNEAIQMGLTPTVVTFNTLFHGYSKEGRPLEGISVLKKMKRRNCMPDYISYSTLLHGLLIWRKIRTALRVYKEMVGNGFEVDARLMNSLSRGLCRKYLKENILFQDAYEVFEKMRNRACVIDHSTYILVIQALSVGKKVDDVLVILRDMIRFGYIPRITTINRIIRAFCLERKVDKGILILVLMHEIHKIPNRMSYDLIIHELNRKGRFLEACNVYGAALVRGMVPDKSPKEKEMMECT